MSETVKQPKEKKELAIFDVKKFSIAQLPELQGKKEEIASIIAENPIVEIIDNETYEQAKKSRTAVRSLRTATENEQKDVKRNVKTLILDAIDTEYTLIVSDIKSEENKRQDIVTAWEAKKEAEKAEKVRLEQLRIDNINNLMNDYVTEWKTAFNLMVFDTVEQVGASFLESYTNYDLTVFEEFESLFPAKIEELTEYLKTKTISIYEAENARVEKIRLAKEAERLAQEKADLAEKQRLADEAEAKAKAEREQFEKEKREFEEEKAKMAKNAEKQVPAETIETPEVLAPELPTANVCTSLETETPITPAESFKAPTWEDIIEDFKSSGKKSYSKFLIDNYNVPTKIQ